ncbi:MAG TPA: hypothetical protein PLV93_03080 [Microthrixaceae bacterium]|nr:hypothetical protein [Microthrixaceae bacterium]HNI34352.1 hypothetical protein [Microthrixaceae bacterium]
MNTAPGAEPLYQSSLTILGGAAGETRQPLTGDGGFATELRTVFERCGRDREAFGRLVRTTDEIVRRETAVHDALVAAISEQPLVESPTAREAFDEVELVRVLEGGVAFRIWDKYRDRSAIMPLPPPPHPITIDAIVPSDPKALGLA